MLERFIEMCGVMKVKYSLDINNLGENKSYKVVDNDIIVEEIKIKDNLEEIGKYLFILLFAIIITTFFKYCYFSKCW